MRYASLVAALLAAAVIGVVIGSAALGDSAGPNLAADAGFNSGEPVAPTFPADEAGGTAGGVEFASAIQSDGKVIVAGQNTTTAKEESFDIARYNANGTLDTSFGTNGYVQVAPVAGKLNFAAAIAIDPSNGDIVIVGGNTSGPDEPELVRLTPKGELDTSFGTGGVFVDSSHSGSFLTAAVVDSSHRIVTLGSDGVVRRYTASGEVDSTFGSSGHTSALVSSPAVGSHLLALQPADGKILVAGTSSGAGAVIRLETNGTPDSGFGSSGKAALAAGTEIRQMTLEGTNIVVGGTDSSGNGMLARLTSSGTLDTTFGTASGYDILAPPSGYEEHIDALFYDPGSPPGLAYCLYQRKEVSPHTHAGVCSSLGVDGQTMGTPLDMPGEPKDGGYSFISNSILVWLSYLGVGLDTTKPTACEPIDVTDSEIDHTPGQVGSSYKAFFNASGGQSPYTFEVTAGSLPPGVTLAANGTLSGTPTSPGFYSFTVTATDSSVQACQGTDPVTLDVNNPTKTTPPPPPPPVTDTTKDVDEYKKAIAELSQEELKLAKEGGMLKVIGDKLPTLPGDPEVKQGALEIAKEIAKEASETVADSLKKVIDPAVKIWAKTQETEFFVFAYLDAVTAQDPPDANFTIVATPAKVPAGRFVTGGKPIAAIVAAANALIENAAQSASDQQAMITDVQRLEGAVGAGNSMYENLQATESAKLASAAAGLVHASIGLRERLLAALKSVHLQQLTVNAGEARKLAASDHGFAPETRTLLARLGVRGRVLTSTEKAVQHTKARAFGLTSALRSHEELSGAKRFVTALKALAVELRSIASATA